MTDLSDFAVADHRGTHAHVLIAEANATRFELMIAYLPDTILVALVNFGKSARIGYGHEWHYIAEKLDVSEPDARAIDNILRAYIP